MYNMYKPVAVYLFIRVSIASHPLSLFGHLLEVISKLRADTEKVTVSLRATTTSSKPHSPSTLPSSNSLPNSVRPGWPSTSPPYPLSPSPTERPSRSVPTRPTSHPRPPGCCPRLPLVDRGRRWKRWRWPLKSFVGGSWPRPRRRGRTTLDQSIGRRRWLQRERMEV